MSGLSPRAHVTLERRRLWTLRLSLGATRWVLYGVAIVGVIATARNAIAPPRASFIVTAPARTTDATAAWFALSFARAYLSWSADPTVHQAALNPFLAASTDPDAGLRTAGAASEQLRWVEIAGERDRPDGEHDYTVAAGTAGGSVRYLAVAVAGSANAGYVLARYPALVGAPAPTPATTLDGGGLAAVANPSVIGVLDRALRNYLDGSAENLAADLAPHATVTPIAPGLALRGVLRLVVEPSGAVLATVAAADGGGDVFTLAYELSLVQVGGRWEIAHIQS